MSFYVFSRATSRLGSLLNEAKREVQEIETEVGYHKSGHSNAIERYLNFFLTNCDHLRYFHLDIF
jgi:hypothetical protein